MESAIKFLTTDKHFSVVGWAFSASDALEKIDKFNPDLVLVDFSLPDVNGFNLTRTIKQKQNPPVVIVLSLNDNTGYSSEALNSGADAFLCKSDFGNKIIPLIESLFLQKEN